MKICNAFLHVYLTCGVDVSRLAFCHLLLLVAVQGDLAYLFITAATDKQWSKSADKLKKMAETFRA